jgi:phosphoribosylformylglycinamidine synthase II
MKDNLWQETGLSEQEYAQIKDLLQREPNEMELRIFGAMRSEHCGHKNAIWQGLGENIGVVDIGEGQAVVLGAAAGVKGLICDVFTRGARPIALLNSLHFGSLKNKETRSLFAEVVAEIAAYGKKNDMPIVAGEVYFHPSYEENYLVNTLCLGLIEQQEPVKGLAARMKIGSGNPVMLVEACLEACLELNKTGYVVGMQALGTTGLISSSCEIVMRAGIGSGIGIEIETTAMSISEMMLSESQEQILLVLQQGREKEVQGLVSKWGLMSSVIGRVTADGFLTIKEGEQIVAQIPVQALTESCPRYDQEAREPEYLAQAQAYDLSTLPEMEDYSKVLLTLLGTPMIASKEWVYNQYDYLPDKDIVVSPGSGAAVLRIKGVNKGLALTVDGNSRYVYLNPYRGGQIAAAEAARNLVCSGARPLASSACLNFGNPKKPEISWQLKETTAGLSDACRELEIPLTGSNISFYHETEGEAIYPTPVVGMIGLVKDLAQVTTIAFKQETDLIILLGQNKDELGASTYLSVIHGLEAGRPPELNLELEKQVQGAALELIKLGLAVSAHDCAEGGLAVALAECCLAGKVGAEVVLTENLKPSSLLFGETQSRIIVTIRKEKLDFVLQLLKNMQVPYKVLGNVGGEVLSIAGAGWKVNLGLQEMTEKYRGAIACLMEY